MGSRPQLRPICVASLREPTCHTPLALCSLSSSSSSSSSFFLFSVFQVLFDTLAIFTHIARESDNNVHLIARCEPQSADPTGSTHPQEDIFQALNGVLIHHKNVKIRQLVCKLLGNLFRHSDRCYEQVRDCGDSPSILESLVHQLEVGGRSMLTCFGCMDCTVGSLHRSPQKRNCPNCLLDVCVQCCQQIHTPSHELLVRNACVALGNAAFHADTLYRSLGKLHVIPHLTRVLLVRFSFGLNALLVGVFESGKTSIRAHFVFFPSTLRQPRAWSCLRTKTRPVSPRRLPWATWRGGLTVFVPLFLRTTRSVDGLCGFASVKP